DLAAVVERFQTTDRSGFQAELELIAFDQFHGHDELSLNLRRVVKRNDIGMAQAAVYSDLTEKALQLFLIVLRAPGQDLEHLQSSKSDVSNLVSNACLGVLDNI